MASWFKEENFQESLLSFICKDRHFLKKCGGLLKPDDFKPGKDEGDERWIVATQALEFWKKYREPIGGMLRVNIAEFSRENNVSNNLKKELTGLVDRIVRGERLVAVEAMEDRVLAYLRSKMLRDAIETLIEKKANHELTVEKFLEISRDVGKWSGKARRPVSEILSDKELESRILRRTQDAVRKRPMLMLDDFDVKTRGIGRGDLGLVVAQYKKGKSLMLSHLADAYAKQKLKVIYITLEDPREEVEDRMDASIAYMPIERLHELPKRLRKRFKKFAKRILGHIRVIDATEGGLTVVEIDELWEQQRDQGFTADVIIVDYDKEIVPRKHREQRRFEFEEIYTDFRQVLAKRDCIGWIAAQAKRLPDNTKVLTSDKTGEDIGKIQKATLAFGIGQGEWHEDARHIYTMAYKRGRAHFGFDIMMSPSRGLFYDRDRTFDYKRKTMSRNGKED